MRRRKRIDFVGLVARPGEPRGDASFTSSRTPEGFLVVDGRIMRDGTLEYGDGTEVWGEYRSRAEIEAALPSFHRAVVTLEHPAQFVNLANAREVWSGQIGDQIGWDPEMPDHIRARFSITSQDAIEAIERGTAELSVGFSAIVEERPGVDEKGVAYRYVQTQILGNHVAIVPEGRAGPDARLLLDHKTDSMAVSGRHLRRDEEAAMEVEITIGGETYMVTPEKAAELQAMLAAPPAEDPPAEDMGTGEPDEPVVKDSGTELAKLRAKADMLEAKVSELTADKSSRVLAEIQAKAGRLGVKLDGVKADPAAIMRACVLAKHPGLEPKLDANTKSPGYLQACFERVMDEADHAAAEQVSDAVHLSIAGSATGGWSDPLLTESEAG